MSPHRSKTARRSLAGKALATYRTALVRHSFQLVPAVKASPLDGDEATAVTFAGAAKAARRYMILPPSPRPLPTTVPDMCWYNPETCLRVHPLSNRVLGERFHPAFPPRSVGALGTGGGVHAAPNTVMWRRHRTVTNFATNRVHEVGGQSKSTWLSGLHDTSPRPGLNMHGYRGRGCRRGFPGALGLVHEVVWLIFDQEVNYSASKQSERKKIRASK